MNELKMCMYQCVYEGKRREKETDIIGVAQAFDSNPSLLMYLYLHTFILFPTFYFTFFVVVVVASRKYFLFGGKMRSNTFDAYNGGEKWAAIPALSLNYRAQK